MNDKFRDDQASKPNAGVVKVHEGKRTMRVQQPE